ncbi:voltage-dependent calcium channel subunit stolid isoform X1 [Megalopta genalis]|uniref:voltage-dependent calcium channel subunit stolid isoform X1 n=1 Tax=Megalopta genalis TaxID=115081 RepID=UPI001443650C|nr:voltage-dependent calcium channel subunit alpha-2/delta-3 isoform X1 [Megalopta genalis]XP_033343038.1 voltage-dependent calcium channel subunit alpha-2/delta-3 isoform X2 [Megalopta genalis]XP_033343039.1 voltage-dependent calcium channel subunit alpha-2/delta-3 isoform X1 [Megalopta genalis]
MLLPVAKFFRCGVLLLLWIRSSYQQEEDIPHIEVKNWALKFGVDLWEFGKQVTKMSEIQRKYHEMEAEVIKKDGMVLVRDMAAEVKNMLDFKMNAVMRLVESAEQAAVSAPRDGNVSPKYYSSQRTDAYSPDGKSSTSGQDFLLSSRHFDHLPVNLTLSTVLLPSGVQDDYREVTAGIQWSEYLDLLFVNNYESDPSLSWQYYGATSGFLRRFPAISWPPTSNRGPGSRRNGNRPVRDVYDFRISNWFIGAANSPKDLAILVDIECYASERIKRLTISTVKTILDTLGPDDYANVYRYGDSAEEIVQCFKDSLIQASPENVQELKVAASTLKHEEMPKNISAALGTVFETLHRYNRTGQGSQCNQAIMLITADNSGLPTDVIKRYNWPHMPVRIFTYLIGGDKSPELHETACANKGFYARITDTEEIKSKVFEYVKVLARPMVLYQHDHPIHWSPVYVGGKSGRYGKEDNGQLMLSVTAPILDRRNYTVKTANLLGIVGTDVPVEEIQKLVPPYKLGVNGYSFIVDNNGRVLYHPDLRPLQPSNVDYEETLKPAYVSVDLSEVELAEYDGPSHPLNNSLLLDLRHDMIDQKEGETNFAIKIHYDDMRRVTIRRHNYFYKSIEGTPFSLGLALPDGYGMFELLAEQEIKHAIINVTEYFKGTNWKVHPDWVYCEYNSASEKWFSTPEDRVLYFLSRARNPGWKWMSLRPRSPSSHHSEQASKPDKDSYYCDKSLVQALVLDALVTDGFDKRGPMHKEENQSPIAILMALLHSQGKGRFGVTRSFIATRSGLFRWHEHQQSNEESIEEPPFAEKYARTMDSSWYKRAVDQHSVEPESFVFSVPFDAADSPNPLVTATHAVFMGKGHKAPAAVVGLQFQHSSLASHFVNITSTCSGTNCKKTCASEELDCYILDNNGFIIISERHEHTGKFFGEIDGTIMDSLVQDRIYRKVTVTDYQGKCSPQESHQSAASKTFPESVATTITLFGHLLWNLAFGFNVQNLWQIAFAFAGESVRNFDVDGAIFTDTAEKAQELASLMNGDSDSTGESIVDDNQPFPRLPSVAAASPASPSTTRATSAYYPQRKLRACEKKTDLYILQPERLNTSGQSDPLKGKLTNCHVTGCERPFSVQKIRHTNLILLVVDTLCPCGSKQLSIEPIEAITEAGACSARRERLYRRRPPKCINYHPEEMEIKVCGGAGRPWNSPFVILLAIASVVYASRLA